MSAEVKTKMVRVKILNPAGHSNDGKFHKTGEVIEVPEDVGQFLCGHEYDKGKKAAEVFVEETAKKK